MHAPHAGGAGYPPNQRTSHGSSPYMSAPAGMPYHVAAAAAAAGGAPAVLAYHPGNAAALAEPSLSQNLSGPALNSCILRALTAFENEVPVSLLKPFRRPRKGPPSISTGDVLSPSAPAMGLHFFRANLENAFYHNRGALFRHLYIIFSRFAHEEQAQTVRFRLSVLLKQLLLARCRDELEHNPATANVNAKPRAGIIVELRKRRQQIAALEVDFLAEQRRMQNEQRAKEAQASAAATDAHDGASAAAAIAMPVSLNSLFPSLASVSGRSGALSVLDSLESFVHPSVLSLFHDVRPDPTDASARPMGWLRLRQLVDAGDVDVDQLDANALVVFNRFHDDPGNTARACLGRALHNLCFAYLKQLLQPHDKQVADMIQTNRADVTRSTSRYLEEQRAATAASVATPKLAPPMPTPATFVAAVAATTPVVAVAVPTSTAAAASELREQRRSPPAATAASPASVSAPVAAKEVRKQSPKLGAASVPVNSPPAAAAAASCIAPSTPAPVPIFPRLPALTVPSPASAAAAVTEPIDLTTPAIAPSSAAAASAAVGPVAGSPSIDPSSKLRQQCESSLHQLFRRNEQLERDVLQLQQHNKRLSTADVQTARVRTERIQQLTETNKRLLTTVAQLQAQVAAKDSELFTTKQELAATKQELISAKQELTGAKQELIVAQQDLSAASAAQAARLVAVKQEKIDAMADALGAGQQAARAQAEKRKAEEELEGEAKRRRGVEGELASLAEQMEEKDKCVVCLEKQPDVLFSRCKHLACCRGCVDAMRKSPTGAICPLCRVVVRVRDVVKVVRG